MSKHTPGPWDAYFSDVSGPYINARRREPEVGFDCIATVNKQLHEHFVANATLLAAGPELAEMLDWVQNYCPVEVQDRIRALLVKAGWRSE